MNLKACHFKENNWQYLLSTVNFKWKLEFWKIHLYALDSLPTLRFFFFFWWDGGYINKYNFLTLFNEMDQHLENLCSSGNQLFPKWWMRIIKSYIGKRCKFTAMVSHNTLQLTFKKLLLWSFGGLSKENIHIYLTGFSKYSFFSSYIPVWGWIFSIYVKQDNTLQKTEMQKPMRIEPSSL